MSILDSRLRSWRRAAEMAVQRAVSTVEHEAVTTLQRVRPLVSPWIERAVSRVSLPGAFSEGQGVRVILEEYFRRTIQTGGLHHDVATASAVTHQRRAVPDGILHLTRSVETRIAQIQRVREFEDADDPIEAVHQLRVASRRLRAFVDMFEPFLDPALVKAARRPLSDVTRAVRDLRDADVQSNNLTKSVARASSEPERVALNHLLGRVRAQRKKRVRTARQRLRKLDHHRVASSLRQMLDEVALRAGAPSANYELIAELAFEPSLRAARDAFAKLGKPNALALHRFRLALKRLRYSAELLEPALGDRFAELHDSAKRLQALLGEHQDSVEFEKLVEKRRSKALAENRETLVEGLGRVLDQARSERRDLGARCLQECEKLALPRLFGALQASAG